MNVLTMGLRGKLVALVLGSLLCFGGTVTYAWFGINKVAKQVEKTNTLTLPFALKVGDIRSRTHGLMRFIWRSSIVAPTSEERTKTIAKVIEFRGLLDKDVDALQKLKHISEEAKVAVEEMETLKAQMLPLVDETVKSLEARTDKATEHVVVTMGKDLAPLSNKMTESGRTLSALADKYGDADSMASLNDSRSLQTNLLVTSAGVGILFLCFAFAFASRIASQLDKITRSVGSASLQVSSASEQLSNASEQLSSSSQEQASALEQTSASLTEISTMSDANSNSAEQVDRSVKEVFSVSETTRNSMSELASAMKLILESNVRIEKLVKVIEEIGEKTEVIDEIVFKTQLLSFNASVEAERAGEHGRGFAVVAQEVGNLALVSGRAAQEISSIVKVSIKEAESVAAENKTRVESGGILAQGTKDKMETVLTNLTGIINSVDKIVSACREQKQGINQISTSIQSLSQATQETAGTAEEAASASVELSSQGVSLLGLVSELRTIVNGVDEDVKGKKESHSSNGENHHGSNNVVTMTHKAPLKKKFAAAPAMQNTGTDGSFDSGAWEKL